MLKKLSLAAAALAVSAGALVPAAPAFAQDYRGYPGYYGQGYYGQGYYGDGYRDRYDRYDSRYDRRGYDDRRYYDRRDYRRCNDGTGGAIICAIAGGLLGNSLAGRHDRGTGTVLGALGGGLAGRAIERGGDRGCSNYRR